ncbi:MAG: hypothetical protein H6Q19_108 [Bacteroidetes bacterium]|nr:hypothetical protein [Bacteroidota bacterium]
MESLSFPFSMPVSGGKTMIIILLYNNYPDHPVVFA